MARKFMLTDVQVKALGPGEKLRRVPDGSGLFLAVDPRGNKWWEFRYAHLGRQTSIGLGSYFEVPLAEARKKAALAREQLKEGKSPAAERKAVVAAEKTAGTTFAEVAASYVEHRKSLVLKGKLKGDDTEDRLRCHVMKQLGPLPIAEISPKRVLDVLIGVHSKGKAATVEKLRSILRGLFRHAILRMGLAIHNPMNELKNIDELKTAPQKPFRYAETPEALGRVLLALEGIKNGTITERATWLAPHVFLRPSEIAGATWAEINFKEKLWRIDGGRMKMGGKHIVPLSKQVLEHLKELRALTGDGVFLFPSVRTKGEHSGRIRPESLRKTLIDLGFGPESLGGTTAHGFRHCASTFLRELGHDPRYVELQLNHVERKKVVRTYNHAEFLEKRAEMMQDWSHYLDQLILKAKAEADSSTLGEVGPLTHGAA